MRRPLCVFCVTLLLTQVAAIYLPQNLLLILAAFFVVALFLCFLIKRHAYCVCILLGIGFRALLFYGNQSRNLAEIEPYLEETVTITARVESPYISYIEGMVGATLQVTSVNDEAASFACYCVLLPEVEEGSIIQASFLISDLTQETDKLSNYSNGVFAQAEYIGDFVSLGYVGGLRGFFIEAQTVLSRIIRIPFSQEVGGVLAAMTVGDRDYVLDNISDLYRKAGLSHVLVVSGLHLSLLCSFVLIRNDTRRGRIAKSALTMVLALLLAGITGASSSILRAVFVLAVCTVGDLINEQADSFTSLSLAGAILILSNGYVVCNLSFQLSFLATFGVLLGSAFAKQTLPYFAKIGLTYHWYEACYTSIIITLFATCATFPILVLWDMNISLLAFVSNLLTFWMIPFILLMGFAGALLGLVPFWGWFSTLFLTSAAILVALLNKVVEKVSYLPGAQLYFETEYAVVVCLVVVTLGTVAYCFKIRYRIVIPCLLSVLALGIVIGNYYMNGVIKVAMVGTSSMPAIIISQNQEAMVLFRGGEYNIQTVEDYLEKRGITALTLVVDLRMDPASVCTLESEEFIWLFDTPKLTESTFSFGEVSGTIFNTGDGGVVVLEVGGTTLATTSGTVTLTQPYSVDVLLATSSSSGSIVGEILLCKNIYETMSTYAPEEIYAGEDEVSLWLRYGGEYKLLGVENGK